MFSTIASRRGVAALALASLAFAGCANQSPSGTSGAGMLPSGPAAATKTLSASAIRRPHALSAGDFEWKESALVANPQEAAAQCDTGWTMVAGGSYYNQVAGNEGPGSPDFANQAWVVQAPSGVSGRAFVSCVKNAIAGNFGWHASEDIPLYSGNYGASCPSGSVEITGWSPNTKEWAFWNGAPANTYFSTGQDWVSCVKSTLSGGVDSVQQTATNNPGSLLTGCPAGDVLVGGTTGDFSYPGQSRMQYPAQIGPAKAWWTFDGDGQIINYITCVPTT